MVCTAGGLGDDPVPDTLGHSRQLRLGRGSLRLRLSGESLSEGLGAGVVGDRYSLLQNLSAQVSWWGVALLKGHIGLVPRLLQLYPDADVLGDFEPQDPVGAACLGRLQAAAHD